MNMPNAENRPFRTTRRTLLGIGAATVAAKAMPDIPFVSTPKVAKAEEASLPKLDPDEQIVKSVLSKSFYSPENPGQFINTGNGYKQEAVGIIIARGDFNVDFELQVDDSNSPDTPGNRPSNGIAIDNGKMGTQDFWRVYFVYQSEGWNLILFKGTNTRSTASKRLLTTPEKSGSFSITMSIDGDISATLPDESEEVTISSQLFSPDDEINLKIQTSPGGKIVLPNLIASGNIDIPPVPEPVPTPEPTPDQEPVVEQVPPAPIEPLFGQMPKEVIGDIANDGFTVYNMGRNIRFNVKEIETVKKAFREHALAFGRDVQIALYDKPSDMPGIINAKERLTTVMPRGCMTDRLDRQISFYEGLAFAENRVLNAFAPNEPLNAQVTLIESGNSATIIEVFSHVFSMLIAGSLLRTDRPRKKGLLCMVISPEELSITQNALFELQQVQSIGK